MSAAKRGSKKNPAAAALGSLGGRATAQRRSPEKRSEMAAHAANTRWARIKNPLDRF